MAGKVPQHQVSASRWDFLKPWPWHYYARVGSMFFAAGAVIELIMVKAGFYDHAIKGAARDADFNRDLARQMLALHEEKLRKKNDGKQSNEA